MLSVCGPTRMTPPADPIVCVVDAYARSEHCRSPVAGCTDRALMSPPVPQASLIGDLLGATGLLQCSDHDKGSDSRQREKNFSLARLSPSHRTSLLAKFAESLRTELEKNPQDESSLTDALRKS